MIDQQLCINCGLCQDICPEDAIIEKDGHLVVKDDDCIYCGACMHVCPSNNPKSSLAYGFDFRF